MIDSLRTFVKTSDEMSKCIQIPLPKRKIAIRSTKSKNNFFAQYYRDIIEHPKRQIRLSFWFGNNISCIFSINKMNIEHPKRQIRLSFWFGNNISCIFSINKMKYTVTNLFQ